MTRFFAHSVKDVPEDEWQDLAAHLRGVGEIAARHGAKFGMAEAARVTGLLHDVGKYSEEFQTKLHGAKRRVDHSTAGAQIAEAAFRTLVGKQSVPVPGRLIACAIAGHHAGLANGAGAGTRTPLQDRLRDASIPNAEAWREEIVLRGSIALPRFGLHPNPAAARNRDGLRISLLARMVFSCLIDADRADTGEFYAKQKGGALPAYSGPGLGELKTRLDAHLAKFTGKEGEVNRIRAEVLSAARATASHPPGLFSLTVPTGGGKTLSSLAFALDHAIAHGLDRIIYVIPFTSIIEQNAEVFREALGPEAILEHHSAFDEESLLKKWGTGERDDSEAQSGERLRLAMETWDGRIVVTTAVQFFESLFSNRTTQCRKLHNIAKSVVILDEAQMLPLRLLEPCLAVLDELARNYQTSVVLCTATQPAVIERPDEPERSFSGGFRDVREIAPDPPGLFRRLSRVRVERLGQALTDEALATRLAYHDRVLAIVGTRRHAREVYELLAKKNPAGTHHLSALMCAEHRSRRLKEIRAALDRESEPCRVVSTTVVEAGVDVNFPCVYRMMAGLDSIAQAAGRCNREGKRPASESVVYVFESVIQQEGDAKPKSREIPDLRKFSDAARTVLRRLEDIDPLSPQAIEEYFRELYWTQTAGRQKRLDEAGILPRLQDGAANLLFPFEDVARDFRMIESDLRPLLIPYQADEADTRARDLMRELETTDDVGAIARKLQRYIVNVPRDSLFKLRKQGVIEAIASMRFEEQFLRLSSAGYPLFYLAQTGLQIDPKDEIMIF